MKILVKKNQFKFKYGVMVLVLMVLISSTCNPSGKFDLIGPVAGPADETKVYTGVPLDEASPPERGAPGIDDDSLWADSSGVVSPGSNTYSSSTNITMDVRDANLLDVLSVLAIKMDAEVIFIPEDPGTVTFKVTNLAPLTAFQLLLQKERLDYLVIGRHYLVGERTRLHQDFFNRMFVSRYGLDYISASNLISLVRELNIPVQIITVAENNRAVWAQGTPIALGKLMEAILAFDRRENVAFGSGGERKIRMPVATATGNNAMAELQALEELLNYLLGTSFQMSYSDSAIYPGEIKMSITRNYTNNEDNQLRYLLVEGIPDHIEVVKKMIEEIRRTGYSPISFAPEAEE